MFWSFHRCFFLFNLGMYSTFDRLQLDRNGAITRATRDEFRKPVSWFCKGISFVVTNLFLSERQEGHVFSSNVQNLVQTYIFPTKLAQMMVPPLSVMHKTCAGVHLIFLNCIQLHEFYEKRRMIWRIVR